jgi:hypothetical protein
MISCQKFAQAAKTFNRVEIFFNQELFTLRSLAVVRKIADRPSTSCYVDVKSTARECC